MFFSTGRAHRRDLLWLSCASDSSHAAGGSHVASADSIYHMDALGGRKGEQSSISSLTSAIVAFFLAFLGMSW